MQVDLTDDEAVALRDSVLSEYENADNEDDLAFWSELHVKLGGEPLIDPDPAEGTEDD